MNDSLVRILDDPEQLPLVQIRVLVPADHLSATTEFYQKLLGQPCNLRFSYPAKELELSGVGPVLIIAGTETALAPFRATDATILVPALDEYAERVVALGGRVVEPPKAVPTGRNMRVRHPDGLLVEYVEHTRRTE